MATEETIHVEDPFADANETYIITESEVAIHEIFYICFEILKLITFLIVIILDGILIHFLRKYRRLHTKTNKILLHYLILNLCSIINTPILLITINLVNGYHRTAFCLTYQLEYVITMLSLVMTSYLVADYAMEAMRPNWFKKHPNLPQWILAGIYSLGVILYIFGSVSCSSEVSYRGNWSMELYIFGLVTVLLIHLLKYCKIFFVNPRNSYGFEVGTIVTLAWLPMLFNHYFNNFLYDVLDIESYTFWMCYQIIDSALEICAYGVNIFVTFVLIKRNKYFQMAFDRMFKKNLRAYDNSILDGEESDAEEATEQPVASQIV